MTYARRFAALLALLFVTSPHLARAAHDQAHARDFPAAQPEHHHEKDGSHPEAPASGRDHADSDHSAAATDPGLLERADWTATLPPPVHGLTIGASGAISPDQPATERRSDPTHHPPDLPRAPPQA